MRAISTFFQVLVWGFAAWLAVGLIGSMRWLSPAADASPEALLALAIKFVALAVCIAVGILVARLSHGQDSEPADVLPWN